MFKLFKGDVGRRRVRVEVQSVRILGVLVLRNRERRLSVVHGSATLRVNATVVLAQHDDGVRRAVLAKNHRYTSAPEIENLVYQKRVHEGEAMAKGDASGRVDVGVAN